MTKTIVLINGAWMSPGCWDDFRKPFEAAGYTIHTPSWPHLSGATPAELRAKPPAGLGALSVGAIVDHHQAFIDTLPEAPLLIGHSFGGLFTQLLLDRGVGVAGIAIDPAPCAGVLPSPTALAGAFPILARPGGWSLPFTISRAAFDKNFANAAPPEMRGPAYDRLVVPTSGRIFYQAASWIGTVVHPHRRTQPLLITVGDQDRTVTPHDAHGAFGIQKASPAMTEFKSFPGHSHFLIAEPGWEEVAGFCLDWAQENAG